jgi:hypothetical protein
MPPRVYQGRLKQFRLACGVAVRSADRTVVRGAVGGPTPYVTIFPRFPLRGFRNGYARVFLATHISEVPMGRFMN